MRSSFSTACAVAGTITPFLVESSGLAQGPAPRALEAPEPLAVQSLAPGEFDDARRTADKPRRLPILEGVAFGIDERGSNSATKGTW